MIDGEYEVEFNSQSKSNKMSKKNQKRDSQINTNDSILDRKMFNNGDFTAENCYIIEGPREGMEAQNIRLNIAMEKSSKMNMINRIQIDKLKSSSKVQKQRPETQNNTIDKKNKTF